MCMTIVLAITRIMSFSPSPPPNDTPDPSFSTSAACLSTLESGRHSGKMAPTTVVHASTPPTSLANFFFLSFTLCLVSPNYSLGSTKSAVALPEGPGSAARSSGRDSQLWPTSQREHPQPQFGRHAPHRRAHLLTVQDRIYLPQQLFPSDVRHCHSRPVRLVPIPLPSSPPTHDFRRMGLTMLWMFRAKSSSRQSRAPSPWLTAWMSSARCGTRPNPFCAPLRPTKFSRTRTCGQTHTTYSVSASGQVNVGPGCVSSTSHLCRRSFCWTDEDFRLLSLSLG